MLIMERLGERARRAMQQRGYASQKALAEDLGQDQAWVSRFFKGMVKETPGPELLNRMATFLGIPEWEALRTIGYPVGPEVGEDVIVIERDDPRADLLARLDDATDDEIDTIKGIINVIVSHSPRRGTEGVLSDGKPKQSDDAGGRTA